MSSDEIRIATADEIIINHGPKDFPETVLYIRYSSSITYKLLGMPISELIYKLFEQQLVEDYSIQYEEQVDHKGRNLPTKVTAYLYLKELKE